MLPRVLYKLHYSRHFPSPPSDVGPVGEASSNVLLFPSSATSSPIFHDRLLDEVESIWSKITQNPGASNDLAVDDATDFLMFDEREGFNHADDEDNDI